MKNIDITDWTNYGKLIDGAYSRSNLLYTPKMNKNKDILCMSWDIHDPYQYNDGKKREGLTLELMDFFFEREVKNLQFFKDYDWVPKILDLDIFNKKIFLEWNGDTVNDLISKGYNIDEICPTWKNQLHNILNDILDSGYYKMSLYTHCFFINNKGILKTFDFYACVERSYPFIEIKKLKGMMGEDSSGRFQEATVNDYVDFDFFFKQAIKKYIKWPDNALMEFYKEKFNE